MSHVSSDVETCYCAALAKEGHASMEPRPFRRGNALMRSVESTTPAPLQWSHVPSDVETAQEAQREALALRLQWSHVPSDVETGSDYAGLRLGDASMEPRPFRRGNCTSIQRRMVVGALQWSHVPSDVETRPGPDPFSVSLLLQWSHVPSDVETRTGAGPLSVFSCFNGATSLQTWKLCDPVQSRQRTSRFNGATSLQTWKRLPL